MVKMTARWRYRYIIFDLIINRFPTCRSGSDGHHSKITIQTYVRFLLLRVITAISHMSAIKRMAQITRIHSHLDSMRGNSGKPFLVYSYKAASFGCGFIFCAEQCLMQMTGNSADDEENFNCRGLIKKKRDGSSCNGENRSYRISF